MSKALEAHSKLLSSLPVRTHQIALPSETIRKPTITAAERARRWRLANPDRERATKRAYRAKRREDLRKYFRNYRAENLEQIRANERRYYQKRKARG